VKNGLDRYVVLNRVAKSVVNDRRGEHVEFVITCEGQPVTKIYNSGWKVARRRAAKRYAGAFGKAYPEGFQSVRVHDLKYTYGHIRPAGTPPIRQRISVRSGVRRKTRHLMDHRRHARQARTGLLEGTNGEVTTPRFVAPAHLRGKESSG
jgi:hypothetical protein